MARGPSSETTERLLEQLPEMKLLGLLHGASNYTFLARLGPHPPSGLNAVYKPARGESPLWDFEAGTLYLREVAAYELSKVLGWPRIPPTVVRRQAPQGIGAVQMFIESDGRHFLGEHSEHRDTWTRIALFDVIANNADRKSGHCLFDADNQVWVIDHGLTFHTEHKLRTVIWDFAGDPLPEQLCDDVERALVEVERGGLGRKLAALLTPAEVRLLKRRLRGVLDPRWRFPEPTSAWSIPWPPV
ncbi:MAG TPA: hypothetical protein VJT78_05425 [Candidatus Dormibacteraeota bacterium]|nr:hypothetical protein [Candidatus Dormibacteraeota bacterium]